MALVIRELGINTVLLYILYKFINKSRNYKLYMRYMLALSVVYHGFRALIGSNERLKIILKIAKHAAFRRKSKDSLARNQDNVSLWGDMSIRGLLFQ